MPGRLTRAEKRALNRARWARGERWSGDFGSSTPAGNDIPAAANGAGKTTPQGAGADLPQNGGGTGKTRHPHGGADLAGLDNGRPQGRAADFTGAGHGSGNRSRPRGGSVLPELELHDTPADGNGRPRANRWAHGVTNVTPGGSAATRVYEAPTRLDGAWAGQGPRARLRAAAQAATPSEAARLCAPMAHPCRCARPLPELRSWAYVGRFEMCAKCGRDVLARTFVR